jgi:hypothetical protein
MTENTDKYLVFSGYSYYPDGGWNDYDGAFSTLEEAKDSVKDFDYQQWAHIVDANSEEIVLIAAGGKGVVEWEPPINKGEQL